METITITLNRQKTQGKAVPGTITFPYRNGTETAKTLENADFLIPAGIYPLDLTWSPKFKKLLPLVQDVPDREGIRIHMGTKPEHSTGCILVDFRTLMMLKAVLETNTKNNQLNQEIYETFEPMQVHLVVVDPA